MKDKFGILQPIDHAIDCKKSSAATLHLTGKAERIFAEA
jgi:hypothetical protein